MFCPRDQARGGSRMEERMTRRIAGVTVLSVIVMASPTAAQDRAPGEQGSRNIKMVAHVPVGGWLRAADVEIEQELSRPYAYIALDEEATYPNGSIPTGIDFISLKNPSQARVMYSWRIEQPELHTGL